jgi:carboxypeptidase family protein
VHAEKLEAARSREMPTLLSRSAEREARGEASGGRMSTKNWVAKVSLFCLTILGVACTANAQTNQGGLAGTVVDASGSVVVGAQISAKGVDTASVYSATSGPTGGYLIHDILVGAYNVTVTAPGFKSVNKTGVVIQINTTSTLDFTMEVGDVKDTVTVIADTPSLEASNAEIGTVVDKKQIEELPLSLAGSGQSYLRSASSFVFLAPGAAGPGTNGDHSSNGTFETKITGGQNFGAEVLIDGASIFNAASGAALDQSSPSVEALDQFKITTSTLPAEFGRTSGGIESFTTRSGKNTYHGTAFDLFRNEDLDAKSWSENFNGQPKGRDRQNNYGGNFGGPVWIPKIYNGHDKSFFFFSWEQYRNNLGQLGVTTLPTAAERTGDFSQLLTTTAIGKNPCDGSTVYLGEIFDPTTTTTVGGVPCRTAYPDNKITTISPVAQKVLSYLPLPNVTPSAANQNGLINNFVFNSVSPQRDTAMTVRIDQNLGDSNKIFVSYSVRDYDAFNGTKVLPAPLDPNYLQSYFTRIARIGWDKIISPTLLNHFSIGLTRIYSTSTGESVTGVDWDSVLGIGNASGQVFPQFNFNGSPLAIGYQGLSTAQDNADVPNSLIVSDSVSWVKGRHAMRFGFEWRSYQFSVLSEANTSPNYTFNNFQTAYAVNNSQTGDPVASFLAGAPNSESLGVYSVYPRWNSNYYAAYGQDDFKFRKDLTFNIGVRYDIDTPRHESHGAESVLDLNAANSVTPGTPGALAFDAAGAKTYYKDIAPRLSFAYAPERFLGLFPNTVLRGGYGIYYSALFYADFGGSLTSGSEATPSFTSPDNFSPVQSPDAGFPSYTPPSNITNPTLLTGTGSANYVAPDYGRPGMTQNWSLEVQHQLATDLILSVAYVGTHATRLHSNLAQINTINPQYDYLGTGLLDGVTTAAGEAILSNLGVTVPSWFEPLYGPSKNDTVGQLLRPHPNYLGISTSCCLENLGQSTYNALEVKLERRFHNGLNLLASYTYSKTLTDADSAYPVFTGFNSSVFGAQNPYNLRAEKAVSYQDVPHAVVLSYLYELPIGPGKAHLSSGIASKVLGGWQVGGVQRYQSGIPTVFNEYATSNPFSGGNYRFSRVPGQPLLAPNHDLFKPLAGNSGCTEDPTTGLFTANSTNNYFNCAAFMDPNAPGLVATRGYTFGDLPAVDGNIRSPNYYSEDFAILKRTTIHERNSLIFKVDLPNAFNRHIFGAFDGNPTSSTFGVAGGGNRGSNSAQRNIQLTLRYQF